MLMGGKRGSRLNAWNTEDAEYIKPAERGRKCWRHVERKKCKNCTKKSWSNMQGEENCKSGLEAKVLPRSCSASPLNSNRPSWPQLYWPAICTRNYVFNLWRKKNTSNIHKCQLSLSLFKRLLPVPILHRDSCFRGISAFIYSSLGMKIMKSGKSWSLKDKLPNYIHKNLLRYIWIWL